MRVLRAANYIELASALREGAQVLGGGTRLFSEAARSPDHLVMVDDLEDARVMDWDGGRGGVIGALTTLSALYGVLHATQGYRALAEALHAMGNPNWRALATVGGRIRNRDGLSDLYPVLRLFSAEMVWFDSVSGQLCRGELAFEGAYYRADCAVVQIHIPSPQWGASRFVKVARTRNDRAIVNLAMGINGKTVRLIVGGLSYSPKEYVFDHQSNFAKALCAMESSMTIDSPSRINDWRGQHEYRESLVLSWSRRILGQLWREAEL